MKGAHPALYINGGEMPIDLPFLLGEKLGIGGVPKLRLGGKGTGKPEGQRFLQKLGSDLGQLRGKGLGGILGLNGHPALSEYGAAVNALVQEHDGDPGPVIAGEDGRRDWGGTAMPGEQGWMKVDAAEGRYTKYLLRQDLAKCSHHNHIRPELS
jgi:hypothetical protein